MSGSQCRSDYATVRFDLALEGRFSALIWVGGKEILFYLKSGKPQEVTLRSFFLLPRPGKHTKAFIGLHACAVRGLRRNTQLHKHISFAHGWPGLMGNLHGKGSHYTSGYTCGTTYIHKHPSLLIFQVQRSIANVSLSLSCSQRLLRGKGVVFLFKLCAMCPIQMWVI